MLKFPGLVESGDEVKWFGARGHGGREVLDHRWRGFKQYAWHGLVVVCPSETGENFQGFGHGLGGEYLRMGSFKKMLADNVYSQYVLTIAAIVKGGSGGYPLENAGSYHCCRWQGPRWHHVNHSCLCDAFRYLKDYSLVPILR